MYILLNIGAHFINNVYWIFMLFFIELAAYFYDCIIIDIYSCFTGAFMTYYV